ncbi:hypothetical protein [Breznakiella homolactica]|uniref:Lipoprotein n=1 Tax=Breznakiella homolactica TaxID=2798577 RepID=A0A7T8BC06_9SPIR|nr:hypothetical protein [Breznakiella homolactica]QQO10926.1 hypothetical protein JFL75_08415 [Breznakiella homolactica]
MRNVTIVFLILFWFIGFGCKFNKTGAETRDQNIESVNTAEIKVDENKGLIENETENTKLCRLENFKIKYNANIDIPGRNDPNMIVNDIIIFKPESDVIVNNSEIEPLPIVNEILDKPAKNITLSMLPEYSRPQQSIDDILSAFNVYVDKEKINEINNTVNTMKYRFDNLQIDFMDNSIYICKGYSENFYYLFLVEYYGNTMYDFVLKINDEKKNIEDLLGKPTYYSSDGNIYAYQSNKTLRQISVVFNEDKVKKVQLMVYGGI